MRVATWNVLADAYRKPPFHVSAHPTPHELRRRRQRVVEDVISMATSVGIDLVCLQEADRSLADALEAEANSRDWSCYREPSLVDDQRPGSMLVLTRRSEHSRLTSQRFVSAPGRWSLKCVLDDPPVAVFGVHFAWSADGSTANEQGRELASLVRTTRCPTVVVGDLNCDRTSLGYRSILDEGFIDVHDEDERPTTRSMRGTLRRSDYVLVRDLSAVSVVLPFGEVTQDRVIPDERCPSDHIALAAELRASVNPRDRRNW